MNGRNVEPRSVGARNVGAGLIGFALGGFFDGILLHQILGWHHLLSGLEGERFRSLDLQLQADGWFHAVMYGVAAVGLWLLWREGGPARARAPVAAALVGFGAWHLIDAVLNHWLLGLHHIRMASEVPVLWDGAWALVFGVVPLWLGLRRGRGGTGMAPRAALGALVLVAGGLAAAPPLFRAPPVAAWFEDVAATDRALAERPGTMLYRAGNLVVLDLDPGDAAALLLRHGGIALPVERLPAGCVWRPA